MAGVAFEISLQDQITPGAQSAAAALGQTESALRSYGSAADSIAAQIASTATATNKAAAELRLLEQAGEGTSDAAKALRSTIAANGQAAAKAELEWMRLTGEIRSASKEERAAAAAADRVSSALERESAKASKAADQTADLGEAAKGAFPFLGELQERASNLSAVLGGIPPGAAVAALAIAAVAAAAVVGAAAFLRFGLASADAAAHVRALAIAQTGSVAAGTALANSVSDIAARTGVATDALGEMGAKLAEAGVSGRDLDSALSAAAGTAVLFGDSAAEAFLESALEAKKAGQSVGKFAADAKAKLGPGLAVELSRPSVAATRLGATLAGLFGGSDVSGFGAALNGISDALSRGSAVGDAMRAVFEALFGGLGASAKGAGNVVVAVLEEMTIIALKVAIAVKPTARRIMELWDSMMQGDGAKTVAYVLVGVFGALAAAVGVAVAVVGAVVVNIGLMSAALGALVAAAFAVGYAIGTGIATAINWLIGALPAAWNAVASMVSNIVASVGSLGSSAMEAAGNFISGLVGGITGGVGMVVDAIKGLASSALGAFKGILGIASPSRVMLQMGGYTAEGFAGGMDAGAADVAASASSLAATPIQAAEAAPAPRAQAATGGARSGGGTVDIGGVQITINGVAGAESILERLPAALADAFEQIAESMGINPAEA